MAVTLEQFVANLIQSGLMSAEDVSSFQESFPPDKRPTDVQGLARELVHAGKVTKYQAAAIYRGKTRGLVLGDSGLCVRAGAYEAVGGYAPLPLFEDLDLSMRLAARGPVRLVPGARMVVCARRWKREGALRATVRNRILTLGWRLGVPAERLAAWYPRHRDDRPGSAAGPGSASPPTIP